MPETLALLKHKLEQPYYKKLLGAYWKTALQDKTKAPLLKALQQDVAENKAGAIEKAVAELPVLKQNLRSGACNGLENSIVEKLSVVDATALDTTSLKAHIATLTTAIDTVPRHRAQLVELQVSAANHLRVLHAAAKLQTVLEASAAVKQLAESAISAAAPGQDATASGQDRNAEDVDSMACLSALSTAIAECKGTAVLEDEATKESLAATMACLSQMLVARGEVKFASGQDAASGQDDAGAAFGQDGADAELEALTSCLESGLAVLTGDDDATKGVGAVVSLFSALLPIKAAAVKASGRGNAKDGRARAGELRRALAAAPSCDDAPTARLRKAAEEMVEDARNVLAECDQARLKVSEQEVVEACARLEPIANGKEEGRSWKEDLDHDAGMEDVMEVAAATLFKQSVDELRKLTSALEASLKKHKKLQEETGQDAASGQDAAPGQDAASGQGSAAIDAAKKMLQAAKVTKSEGLLLKLTEKFTATDRKDSNGFALCA